MLRPFLIVGVGGSGGKTLRIIRDELMLRLRQKGWDKPDLPAAWQFLHVDVPTHADGDEIDLPPQLPHKQYIGMVANGVDYPALDKALLARGGSAVRDALATWRPDPKSVQQSPGKGAGQYRALGRLITLTGLEKVQKAVQNARREITGTGVVAELQEATRLLGGTIGNDAGDPQVIVISSIAGGTGAGAVIDVCDVIRALPDKWASESFGFLYAPDVFSELAEEHQRGVRANALGTLAELLNGYWNNSGPSQATSDLLGSAGVVLNQTSRRSGPRYPFLVGAANEKITHKSQNDVYRAMGRSIASWVASERLQDSLIAYTGGNWNQANARVDNLPLRAEYTESPFSAIGSSRVGLGRDRFMEYASQYLARTAVDRMVEEHETRRRDAKDDRTPKQLIADLEQQDRGNFRTVMGLNELGPDHNDILNALKANTDGAKHQFESLVNNAVADLLATTKKGNAPANEVVQRAMGVVRDNDQRISADLQQQTLVNARNWVVEIQRQATRIIAQRIGESGGPVTHALLEHLINELHEVQDELGREAKDAERHANQWEQLARESAGGYEKSLINSPSHEVVQKVTHNATQAVLARYNKYLRLFTIELIGDFVKGFLAPLSRSVNEASEKLAIRRKAEGSVVESWPFGDTVPVRLRPAPNEFLLQSTDQYHQVLKELISRTIGVDVPPAVATRTAEISVLLGNAGKDDQHQELIKIVEPWIPSAAEGQLTQEVGDSPRHARFSFASEPEEILWRAENWLRREGTAVGKYLSEGLRDYLSEENASPAEHERRLQQFEGQLIAAIDTAAPLASINKSVLVNVHNVDEINYTTQFSEIPLPEGSPAKKRMQALLESRHEWRPDVAKSFVDNNGGFIDIFTLLNQAYQPVVFDSIMKPIAEDWHARSKNPDSRKEFSQWRRSRPIGEFLPLSRNENNSVMWEMIRGWFVAQALGQLRVNRDSAQIFIPTTDMAHGRWASFPSPMLSSEELTSLDGLAVILVGVVLAMLEVNIKESVEPMAPYARLRQLGQTPGTFDNEINGELSDWIKNGTNLCPDEPEDDAQPEIRKEELLADFEGLRQMYYKHFTEVKAQYKDPHGYPRAWDIRNDILACLDELIHGVRRFDADGGSFVMSRRRRSPISGVAAPGSK